jgi:hypothetical protein
LVVSIYLHFSRTGGLRLRPLPPRFPPFIAGGSASGLILS